MNSVPESKTPESPMAASDLKHELRTHLTSIMGYIELLREASTAGKNGKFPPDLEKIWVVANEMAALVEDCQPVWGIGYPIKSSSPLESDDMPQARPEDDGPGSVPATAVKPSEAGRRLRGFIFGA